jgi:hypothetical protein
MPVCNKCGVEKEQDQFTKDNRKPGGYSKICQKCTRQRQIDWENKDKDRILQKRKQYREDNAEYIKQKKKDDYAKLDRNIELAKRHKYYVEHKEEFLAKCKQYKQENSAWKKAYDKQYAQDNKDKIYEYKRQHKLQNWDHYNELNRINSKRRKQEDIQYKLATNLRSRVRTALKYNKKADHSLALVGCTLGELKQWLESQFTDGMSWDNWGKPEIGKTRWNIDHSIPVTWFDLSDPNQQRECFNYKNLQPMWWWENIKKSNKFEGVYKEA